MEEEERPATPRLDAWYERPESRDARDRTSVSVWYPREPPTARLATIGHGPDLPDTLPPGPLTAYVTLAGVTFGGALDELEWFIDAARDALKIARWQAEEMASDALARSSSGE